MKEAFVDLQTKDGIATITFFHPASNSLPGEILKKIADTITQCGADNDVKLIVLKSEGEKAFCAGASFDELVAIDDHETGIKFFSGFANVINAIRKCPKFVLGRVQGKAVGGGVGIASAVDYCFARDNASIKLSELAVGIGPFVVGPAVERKVGLSGMSELAIAAWEWRSAEWALNKGLYQSIHSSIEELDQAVDAFAQKLITYSPEAMRELKQVFWQGTENWDSLLLERAGISGDLVRSDFTRNAIAAFKAAVEKKKQSK